MSPPLFVYCDRSLVGTLTASTFSYHPDWVASGCAISASLPLSETPYGQPALRWFGNLLPEGGARERIARRLRLSPDDDFALLGALGRECAGALTLLPDGVEPQTGGSYRPLTEAEIGALGQGHAALPLLLEEARLSLAGAQDKLAVAWDPDGSLSLPLGGAPSTHILKCENRDFAGLVENELLCLRLAARVELPAAKARVIRLGGALALLVERFDRASSEDGTLRRIHQEDFAQALGVSRHEKYEHDAGPTLASCAQLLRTSGQRPALEIREVLRWTLFNLTIGNRDNHAKNLSRLKTNPRSPRWELAPFYDLLNTTGYKLLTRKLAFRIGGAEEVQHVRAPEWRALAAALGVTPALVESEAERMIELVSSHLRPTSEAVAKELGNAARLAAPVRAIEKSLRLVKESV